MTIESKTTHDYRPPLFQHTSEAMELGETAEREASRERSLLDAASAFLGDHQVVELLAQGAQPLFTVSALRVGERVEVVPTLHVEDPDLLRASTYAVLNACRDVIDSVDGEGEAAKALFVMAMDPREQPGPDPEMPGEGVPHEDPDEGDADADDDDE